MCECREKVNKLLAEHNATLHEVSVINMKTGKVRQSIAIQTERLYREKKYKKQTMIPTFCPFCGDRYRPIAEADTVDASASIEV